MVALLAAAIGGLASAAAGYYAVDNRKKFKNENAMCLNEIELATTFAKRALSEDEATTTQQSTPVQSFEEMPLCVQKWMRHAIRNAPPETRLFTVEQHIKLFVSPRGGRIKGVGKLRTSPLVPTFYFTGTTYPTKGLWIEGYEKYAIGEGMMRWHIWGVVNAVTHTGPAIDNAGASRWMLEAIFCPQVLIPSKHLHWEPIPDNPNQARAVLSHQGLKVSTVFTFNPETNNVTRVESTDYARALTNGKLVKCGIIIDILQTRFLNTGSNAGEEEGGEEGGVVIAAETDAVFVDAETGEHVPYVHVLVGDVDVN